MKYKQFILGFLCAIIIGCTIGAMQPTKIANVGTRPVEEIPGFALKIDLEYDPPGIIDEFEKAGDKLLENLSPGLSNNVQVYRHNFKIDYQGHVVDKIIYVRKSDAS